MHPSQTCCNLSYTLAVEAHRQTPDRMVVQVQSTTVSIETLPEHSVRTHIKQHLLEANVNSDPTKHKKR